ncbi:hypothetical protein CDD82_5190 [Ophiocordyceps australis]|uniref:Uncharacterized protein n=1 Tax=Ophiocordyceps australis TaxID=1399860 RepID=A0A2C5YYV2_9HYPO|nr:hypothetical protein CDD82_5190 [Ophiocordyceps australis]
MDAATPLLRPHSAPAAEPVSGIQRSAIRAFAALHLVRAALIVTAPFSGLTSLVLPATGTTYLLCALVGQRDMILAALLATAEPRRRREVLRALATSLVSDAADSVVLIFAAAASGGGGQGWMRRSPLVEIAAVATLAILEHLVLWSLSAADGAPGGRSGAEVVMMRAEDKQLRLDMWLADMRRVAQPV